MRTYTRSIRLRGDDQVVVAAVYRNGNMVACELFETVGFFKSLVGAFERARKWTHDTIQALEFYETPDDGDAE